MLRVQLQQGRPGFLDLRQPRSLDNKHSHASTMMNMRFTPKSGAFSFHVMEQRLGWSFVYGGQSSSIAEIKHDHQCNGWKVSMNKQQSTLSKTCPGGAELEKNKHVSKSPQRKCGRMQMKTMKRLQILSLNLPWKPLMQPAGRTHRYTAGSGSGAWL